MSKNNVPLANYLQNDNSNKLGMERREFYEETVERKQRVKHVQLTQTYYKAKKKYNEFQRQINQITSIIQKEITNPEWYQELSGKQIDVLNTFGEQIQKDHDMDTTACTRQALKALGMNAYLPRTVVKDALVFGQLDPLKFLTAIKEYLIKKARNASSHKKKPNETYSLYERILMSSILHLAYPSLIKKLDYCLKKPEPDKKLEYKKQPKSKRTLYNDLSPYLEALPEPVSWTEQKDIKWHNANVKTQMMRRKKLKNEQQKRMHNVEHLIEENTSEQFMKTTNSEHQVDDGMADSKGENDSQTYTSEYTSNNDATSLYDSSDKTSKQENVSSMVVSELSSNTSAVTINVTSSEAETSEVALVRRPTVTANGDDRRAIESKIPYGWLGRRSEASNVSASSTSSEGSSVSVGPMADDANNTVVVIDFDNSEYSYNSQRERYLTVRKGENNCPTDTSELGDDIPFPEGMMNFKLSKLDNKEKRVLNVFLTSNLNVRDRSGLSDQRMTPNQKQTEDQQSAVTSDTDITVAHINRTKQKTLSMTTMPRTPPPSRKSDYGGRMLFKKTSILNLPPEQSNNRANSSSSSDPSFEDSPQQKFFNEDGSVNLKGILPIFRNLPPWKQLKAVLQFLSILGDPIAGYPQLINLNKLQRWYEIRLNKNRNMTSKFKKKLMKNSIALWKKSRPKLTNIGVDIKSIREKNKYGQHIDWNQINNVKRKIKKTKTDYTTELKYLAINNAREFYPTMYNEHFKNKLSNKIKHTFYDYFPSKEDDCLFGNVQNINKMKKKKPKGTTDEQY